MLGRNVDSIVEWKTIHKCSSTDTVSFRFAPCRRPPSYEKHQKHSGQERARKHRESLAQEKPMPLAAALAPPAPRPPINRSLGQRIVLAPARARKEFRFTLTRKRDARCGASSYRCVPCFKARNCQLATSCFVLAAPARARGTPSPPPPSDDSAVSGSPSPPDSPRIVCSQYRQAHGASAASQAREEPPTFIAFQESVSDRRRRH